MACADTSVNFRPCFSRDTCSGSEASSTAICWVILFIHLFFALLFLGTTNLLSCCVQEKNHMGDENDDKEEEEDVFHQATKEKPVGGPQGATSNIGSNTQKTETRRKVGVVSFANTFSSDMSMIDNDDEHADVVDFDESPPVTDSNETRTVSSSPFVQTYRSESNFLKRNDDPSIQYPSSYSAEYNLLDRSPLSILKHVYRSFAEQKQLQRSVFNAAGLASLSSSFNSLLILMFKFEDELGDSCPDAVVDRAFSIKYSVQGSSEALASTLDAYKFLPLFLLLAYIAFLVERWRHFLVTCHMIQGAIHDIGLLCGSSPDVPVSPSSKKKLYKIYRYLNLTHVLCLKSFSASLRDMKFETDYVHKLGLLTEDEAILVSSMENKARDGMLTLLAHTMGELLNETRMADTSSQRMVLNQKICDLRANCARLHDLFLRDNPNEYIMFMNVLTFTYSCLVVLGYPILLLSYSSFEDNGGRTCMQPGIWLGVFFVLLSLSIPSVMFDSLQNPFDKNGDRINVDNLMASSDLCLFQNMRSLWHFDKDMRASVVKAPITRSKLLSRKSLTMSYKGGFGEI